MFLDAWKSIEIEDSWYKSIHFLGKGGSATTYLAMCSSPASRKGTLWAIKFYTNFSKPERIPSFLAAFDFLKKCEHPSIMNVVNAGAWYRYPAIVAEYLPMTLKELIVSDSASTPEKISYAMQLLSALVYLDEKEVIHRDIKPQNIFLRGKSCILGDFGLMKPVKLNEDEDREIIKESRGPGMPVFYRTPDLISYYKNEKSITTSSDVYQLGLVLAELFTGRNPMKIPPKNDKGEFMFDSPVEREEVAYIRGDFGLEIKDLIEQMIEEKVSKRPKAHQLVDWWEEVFKNVVDAQMKVEGRVL